MHIVGEMILLENTLREQISLFVKEKKVYSHTRQMSKNPNLSPIYIQECQQPVQQQYIENSD